MPANQNQIASILPALEAALKGAGKPTAKARASKFSALWDPNLFNTEERLKQSEPGETLWDFEKMRHDIGWFLVWVFGLLIGIPVAIGIVLLICANLPSEGTSLSVVISLAGVFLYIKLDGMHGEMRARRVAEETARFNAAREAAEVERFQARTRGGTCWS